MASSYPVLWIVPALIAAWLLSAIVMWTSQERFVFFPPRTRNTRDDPRLIEYASDDGVSLFAYVIGTHTPGQPVILAIHGNADLSRWFVPWAERLAGLTGCAVVLAEYRGYDGIPGPPTCAGVARDARAALAAVRQSLDVSTSPMVYFGHSLGAAIVAELAAESPPAVLILQSPFSSARDMAKRMMVPGLSLLWPVMSRIPYDNVARVRELDCPVWVAHGANDRLIPARMGQAVFAAACDSAVQN